MHGISVAAEPPIPTDHHRSMHVLATSCMHFSAKGADYHTKNIVIIASHTFFQVGVVQVLQCQKNVSDTLYFKSVPLQTYTDLKITFV